jgi:2-keto-3-deoxy-6-phosphogluconate aldolase
MTELSGEGHLTFGAMRIVASGTVTPPAVANRTSMGLEISKTFVIKESEPIENKIRQYELYIDGQLVWTGIGDDRADALLQAIISATGQGEETPDN